MKNAKKVLALAISVLMIATMFSIVPMGVSAEDSVAADGTATASRLDNWQGNINTILAIGSSGSHADVDEATGYHLYPDADELYVGDTIQTDGNWLNYELNYTNESGEVVSGTLADNANWYCDGSWKFASQLKNGKINGWTDNTAKTFDTAGTWTCTVKMSTGDTITLTSFEVNAIPRFFGGNIFTGNIATVIPTGGKTIADETTGYHLMPNDTDLYVGDTITTDGSYMNYEITYVNDAGETVSSKINDGQWYCDGTWMFRSQLYYGKINGSTDNSAKTLSKAGTWTCTTTTNAGDTVTLTSFEVKDLPRCTYDLDGNATYAGAQDVTVTPNTTLEFSTYDLYVGDKLVQGYNGYWTDKQNVAFTVDGANYTGAITRLKFMLPSGEQGYYKNIWMGGAIDYVLPVAGTYTIVVQMERVKDADGNSASDFYDVTLGTFDVKECPHNYELTETVVANCATEGYELYTCSFCGTTEKRNIVAITGEHNFTFTETVAPTCTAKGYDLYTCDACNSTEQRNTVVATGHTLSIDGDTVTCADCDYTNTYTGESVDVSYDLNDLTGLNGYTTAHNISAFVGDTLTNASCWWKDHTFTYGELSGQVYNVWVVKGDLDYFKTYRENRLANGSYTDENVNYISIGYGNIKSVTLDEAGTYTIVAALQCYEGANFLTNIEPIVIGTVEVFDAPITDVEGDIDGDKEVTAADLVVLQQHVLGISTLEDATVADINKDGIIDAVDLVLLQYKILGL